MADEVETERSSMSLHDFDPLSRAFLDDPYTAFKRLRDESPVHFVASRKIWVVTRYTDVVAAARNHAVFSSTGGVGYDWNSRPMMPMYDPPAHSRMRRMVAKHFAPNAIGAIKPRIEESVDEIVERALKAETIDVVADLALPLSLATIAELLGIPARHRGRLRRWSAGTLDDLAGGLGGADARRADELRREFNAYLLSLIEERRAALDAGGGQGTDVITALIAAHEDEKLSQQELVAFCVLLVVAGFETTVNAIANGTLALLDNPAQLEKLRNDTSLLPGAVEEMVRYDGPVLSFFRNTLSDTKIGDTAIPKGSKVMLAFASANRDERQYPDPDTFLIDRDTTDHVAYGAGVHFCLGAPLARLQLTTLFGALLDKTGTIARLGPAVRTASVLFRGVKTLAARIVSGTAGNDSDVSAQRALVHTGTKAKRIEPFRVEVEESVLTDLRERLQRVRWPDEVEWPAWDYGTPRAFMEPLVAHWRDHYDWRVHEAALNELPHFRATIDDLSIHFVHVKSRSPNATPLLLLHGWPGPFNLFKRVLEPLANPMDGGRAFDLVVGSLPGFPFSGTPRQRGMGTMAMADVFAQLMKELGYDRYGVVGEDWGAGIASRLGLAYPERIIGIHLNTAHENPPRDQMTTLSADERAWQAEVARTRNRSFAHVPAHEWQPQSLAYGLTDSPVGLAGWLVDKYRAGSDCDGNVEKRFSKDELLTNIMLYWVTGAIGPSLRVFYESRQLRWSLGVGERINVPTSIAHCKHAVLIPPRQWIERVYDLRRLTMIPAGAYFGAWEEPTAISDDVRSFFDELEAR